MTKRILLLVALFWASPATADEAAKAPDEAPAAEATAEAAADAPAEAPAAEGGMLTVAASLNLRGDYLGAVPTDATGALYDGSAGFDPQLRLSAGLATELGPLHTSLELEGDVHGELLTAPELDGVGLPRDGGLAFLPRKAMLAVRGDGYRVAAGLMTSHWGLGLLANDGAHGWTPGSARFTDPRGGDVVLRVMGTVGLVDKLALTLAADHLQDTAFWPGDDTTLAGDRVWQGILALTWGAPGLPDAGLYVVVRNLVAEDGADLTVGVADLFLRKTLTVGEKGLGKLHLAAELALVAGTTTLAPSVDFPRHGVMQGAGVLQANLETPGDWGVVTDFFFASGDQNLDDRLQNAFKADPNFDQGILLYDHVLAAQSGRAVATASNLELVGQPAANLDRFPTRGSVTNTVGVFPRAWWRPMHALEVYGGPLVAFGAVPTVDPFNTRLAGGQARNALDGDGGRYLGTELDLGTRYVRDIGPTHFQMGLELALFLPGGALQGPDTTHMDPVFGGRLTARVGF